MRFNQHWVDITILKGQKEYVLYVMQKKLKMSIISFFNVQDIVI